MNIRNTLGLAAVTIALLGLTACSSDGDDMSPADDDGSSNGGYGAPAPEPEEDADETTSGLVLGIAETDLGSIVVDGQGMTVYQFDSDEQGSGVSTCEGQCAQNWPAVPGSDAPELEGVTGEIDTITGIDGELQLTLNGWPLYYYAADEAPGDITGQGVGDVWWVLTPDGEPIRD